MCREPSRQRTNTRRFLACSASYSWRSLYCIARGCLAGASRAADCAWAWPMDANRRNAERPMNFVMMNRGNKAVWNVGQARSDREPGPANQRTRFQPSKCCMLIQPGIQGINLSTPDLQFRHTVNASHDYSTPASYLGGKSNTRHVVVACAYSLPAASTRRASAVATWPPTWMVRPSARTSSTFLVSARSMLTFNSSVV